MPKDPTRNITRYKIRGSHLNEFEFHKHQGEMAEEFQPPEDEGRKSRSTQAERVAQLIAKAKQKAAKNKKRRAKTGDAQTATSKAGAASAQFRKPPIAKAKGARKANRRSGSSKKAQPK